MSIKSILNERFLAAMAAADIDPALPAAIARSKQANFGDYQANGVLGAAKRMKTRPRDLAETVVKHLQLDGIASKVELAGPGFINIFLSDDFVSTQLREAQANTRAAQPGSVQQKVVIDYSSPNLAKEMHVGHLRSTVIGDALARLLEFKGCTVVRQNHMGDWGTQFGMLIAELDSVDHADSMQLADLEAFYQQSKKHFDDDEAFAVKAREYVVKLQSGDAHCKALWQRFIDASVAHSVDIYSKLGITLEPAHIKAESAYNDQLHDVVQRLEEQGLAVDDAGAKVVFLEELADKKGNPSPMIVQKSGGGFLYATTDIAALDYRCNTLKADRLMYFIDARQSLHMKQLFVLGRKAGIAGDDVSLEHHAFGTIMGKDGTPFKTRSGGTVKLANFLDEAIERAEKLLSERDSSLSADAQKDVAQKVAMGAVKYADLSKTRTNDYVFDWDSMLSFEGNTAPYLQYAYTRIQSIFRKAEETYIQCDAASNIAAIQVAHEREHELALLLLQFPDTLEQMAAEAYPHILCTYLYDLASLFMSFYEACPILKPGIDEATRDSRLGLSHLSADVLACGLDLLGIEVMDYM